MIAPARIMPPPPLQWRSSSHGGGPRRVGGPLKALDRIGSTHVSLSSPRRCYTERKAPVTSRVAAGFRDPGPWNNDFRPDEEQKGVSLRPPVVLRRAASERCITFEAPTRYARVPPWAALTTDLAPRASLWMPAHMPPLPTTARVGARAPPSPQSRAKRGGGCNTRTSREVTHPSTTLAQARLTAEFRWDPVH
jgi:hypothetical protein